MKNRNENENLVKSGLPSRPMLRVRSIGLLTSCLPLKTAIVSVETPATAILSPICPIVRQLLGGWTSPLDHKVTLRLIHTDYRQRASNFLPASYPRLESSGMTQYVLISPRPSSLIPYHLPPNHCATISTNHSESTLRIGSTQRENLFYTHKAKNGKTTFFSCDTNKNN